jgi:hypothetical protein
MAGMAGMVDAGLQVIRMKGAAIGERWRMVAGGRWQVAGGRWQVAGGRWQVAADGGTWRRTVSGWRS